MLYLMLKFPKHTKSHFFHLYQKYQFFQDIFGCSTEPSSTKNWSFVGKMAGKDGKITFFYISISYLKIEIRQILRPSQRAGLICFYQENR